MAAATGSSAISAPNMARLSGITGLPAAMLRQEERAGVEARVVEEVLRRSPEEERGE